MRCNRARRALLDYYCVQKAAASKSNSFSWTNRVSVWRNTSQSCHPRKFFCVNCKNHLRRQKRIISPTDERNTKREKKSKKEQAEKEDDAEERVVRVFWKCCSWEMVPWWSRSSSHVRRINNAVTTGVQIVSGTIIYGMKREKKSKKEQTEKNYNLMRVLRHSFFVSTQRSTLNPHSLTPSTLKWITQWTDKDVWKCGCVNHIIVPFSAK